jgi:hypothetical protein
MSMSMVRTVGSDVVMFTATPSEETEGTSSMT